MVTINKKNYAIAVSRDNEDSSTFTVQHTKESHKIRLDWPVGSTIIYAKRLKRDLIAQLMRKLTLGYRLIYLGSEVDVLVRTPVQFELAPFMPVKQTKEAGNVLKSPMPGSIVAVSVNEGDKVVFGQEVVIVEAMKMRNVLRAPRDGIIKNIFVKVGQAVAVDEVLVDFS